MAMLTTQMNPSWKLFLKQDWCTFLFIKKLMFSSNCCKLCNIGCRSAVSFTWQTGELLDLILIPKTEGSYANLLPDILSLTTFPAIPCAKWKQKKVLPDKTRD
jgi:hypothetical protein